MSVHMGQEAEARGRRAVTEQELRRIYTTAAAHIRDNYAEDLTVGAVARVAWTSPRQLQRAFEAIGDTTFRAYVRGVRMDIAREAIEGSPHISIREVGLSVGYRQAAQFTKAFRSRHGMNPSALRSGRLAS
jgi:transcriptional regulator GlxA family with amidase domain